MEPRIVFRTHYQVDEPAYMEFLIKLCTSPIQSAYPEIVAQKLAQEIRVRGREFNIPAGRYAIDLARALGLITDNNTWTDKGILVNLIAEVSSGKLEEQLNLNSRQKMLHFRIFLEADGAALLFIARRVIQEGSLMNADTTWSALARDMFVQVYSDYLALTNNTADRVALRREVDRISTRGYDGKTGPHKAFIHMQTLYRLGLLFRLDASSSRIYRLPDRIDDMQSGLEILVKYIPDVFTLERLIKERKWAEVAAKVFQINCTYFHEDEDRGVEEFSEILSLMISYYQRIMASGIALCPLSTLIDAVQIEFLTQQARLLSYDAAMKSIVTAQKKKPKDIRFHVDRRGVPAFLKLSEGIIGSYVGEKT